MFEAYRWYLLGFLGVALVQGMLIGSLLIERRTRRAAELVVREAEQRYRTVADFNYDWEDWSGADGTFAYVSPSCQRVTGYAAEAFYAKPELLDELIVEDDRDRWREHAATARSGAQYGASGVSHHYHERRDALDRACMHAGVGQRQLHRRAASTATSLIASAAKKNYTKRWPRSFGCGNSWSWTTAT